MLVVDVVVVADNKMEGDSNKNSSFESKFDKKFENKLASFKLNKGSTAAAALVGDAANRNGGGGDAKSKGEVKE